MTAICVLLNNFLLCIIFIVYNALYQVYSGCMCEHDTEGIHCDSCRAGFNALQWRAGTDTDANECQREL